MMRDYTGLARPCLLHAARVAEGESALDRIRHALRWPLPARPVHIVGPLHFVGTRGLGSWLFSTDDGLILLNTGLPHSGPMIARSIEALGFDWRTIRILLVGHAHLDHAGAIAWFQERTGASVRVMAQDAAALADGGRSDFVYGRWRLARFPPAKIDAELKDRDVVTLGGVRLEALRTPGHTPGATTWMTTLHDGERPWCVAFPDGTGVNPGYRLVGNTRYPNIARDYRLTFRRLARLRPDIWFAHHAEFDDFEHRRQAAASLQARGWENGKDYADYVARGRAAFAAALAR